MADNEQRISINKQGISGGIVERKIFGDSGTQLSQIWSIGSISEIPNIESLQIPDKVYQYTQQQYDKSCRDGKERSASVGWKNGIVIDNEQVGKRSLHDLLNMGEVSKFELSVDSMLGFAVKRLFNKSQPINFHLHPDFSDEFTGEIKRHKIHTLTGKTFEIPISSYLNYFRFISSTYSPSDLGMLLESNRYTNSLLLMTPQRYLYVTPPELCLNFGVKGYSESSKYDKELDEVFAVGLLYYYNLRTDDIIPVNSVGRKEKYYRKIYLSAEEKLRYVKTEDGLFALRDGALVKFCNENNLTAFASISRFDRKLKRLS